MDNGAVCAAAVENLTAFVRRTHRRTPGARVDPRPDVFVADSGVADATFNLVLDARFTSDQADRRIAETVAEVRATGRPFAWWVYPSDPADLGERLRAAGLGLEERGPVMAAELTAACLVPGEGAQPPQGLEIREVRDAADLASFADLLAESGDQRAETIVEFFDRASGSVLAAVVEETAEWRTRLLLGLVRGVPVCTAQVVCAAGIAGIYNVVTGEGHRRRGLGAALTLAAMRAGYEAGCRTAVLEASPMGEPVYRRLGFAVCGEFAVYAIEP